MELINGTRMEAGYTLGLEPSGRESLVVVAKGTFNIPENGESITLASEQVPLTVADVFDGDPAVSAPVREIDFAPTKRRCDVLVAGSAYAPGGRPTARVTVGLRVGEMAKSFVVVGDRQWRSGISGVRPGAPETFTVMPISYDRAFGGIDDKHDDPAHHVTFRRNPVGRGFHTNLRDIDGSPMPNSEELSRAVEQPNGSYAPMGLGPVGRNWEPRWQYAGTYDQQWLDEHFPFLPPDFDDRYFQASPEDQQIAVPRGETEVILQNLTPDGMRRFRMPAFDAPVHFFPRHGDREEGAMLLDTIVVESDLMRLTLTWRATRELRRDIFEMSTVLVGHKSRGWWRARDSGKAYYSSLAELVKFAGRE